MIAQKGILNIGGKSSSVYDFARKYNPEIKKKLLKKNKKITVPVNTSMNLSRLNKLLKRK